MNKIIDSTSDESNLSYISLCSSVTLQSDKKGFFQQLADCFVNSLSEKWFYNFGKLKSNEERIEKCLNDEKIRDKVREMMNNVQEVYRGKSAKLSKYKRFEADQSYEKGNLERALMLYTQSVIRAPVAGVDTSQDNGSTLAYSLWERSKTLNELKRIRECLDDVRLCLKEKLPDNLRLNAYWRMAECYINLMQYDQARITLNVLLQIIRENETENVSREWNDKINSKLNELIIFVAKSKELNEKSRINENAELPLIGEEHPQLSGVSSKLKLAWNKKAGTYFVCDSPIKTGNTLVVENAYATSLYTTNYGSHCHHCLCRLRTAIPCPDCSGIAFCSLDCRTKALNTYHKFECHFLDLLIGSGMSALCFVALRIVSQQNVKYFENAQLNNDKENSHPYKQVYNMVRHDDKRDAEDFFRRTLMALFLLGVLKKSGYFVSSKNVEDIGPQEILVARVLLRNLEILQFNAHEISETVRPKDATKALKTIDIGVGLYKSASYFNHECFPAVARYFVGTKLIVKAIRPLAKNEIAGDCYGPIYWKSNPVDRRKKLFARYWFECECEPCSKNWPTLDQLSNSSSRSDNNRKSSNVKEIEEKLEKLKNYLKISPDDTDERLIKNICKSVDFLTDRLRSPHEIYYETMQTLIQYWLRRGNVFEM